MRSIVMAAAVVVAACALGCASGGKGGGAGGVTRVVLDTTKGRIVLELDGERAPVSTANFLRYVDERAYDGTIFHRVVAGFVVQGGGHTADLAELPSHAPIVNEWGNGLTNGRGTIGMARETEPDSATRQWYINLADNARLDIAREVSGNAGYAVFGRVVDGMDAVDAIAAIPTGEVSEEFRNVPTETVVVLRARLIRDAQ
ncbi:MAG: peptidylprolyl isomerase [Phycisphaeraceae bacterium]|nr:peptidylprolyl isomerase [Phycisphaeraceae bacterium]